MLLFPLSTFRMVCSGAFTWSKLARTGARRTINSITVSLLKLILLCTYTSIMEHVLRNLVLVTECQFLLHCLTFFLMHLILNQEQFAINRGAAGSWRRAGRRRQLQDEPSGQLPNTVSYRLSRVTTKDTGSRTLRRPAKSDHLANEETNARRAYGASSRCHHRIFR